LGLAAYAQPTLLAAERHLYAALISDLPTLLPACESWEDYVWANVQVRMESAIEQRRKELGGFWYDEEVAMGQDDGEETSGGLDEVFVSIARSGSNQAR
jgi:nuclear pore complex protein Nup107